MLGLRLEGLEDYRAETTRGLQAFPKNKKYDCYRSAYDSEEIFTV